MSRSKWKGLILNPNNRNSIISPQDIGKSLFIHTGKSSFKFLITPKHVGHKLGEFGLTKISPSYKS